MEQLYLTSNPGPEIDEQNIYDTINKYQVVKSPRLHCFYHIIILIFGAKIQKKSYLSLLRLFCIIFKHCVLFKTLRKCVVFSSTIFFPTPQFS